MNEDRVAALNIASVTNKGDSPAQIVAAAEAYYQFLIQADAP